MSSRNPQTIVEKLKDYYKFQLKGTGAISYHLGADFDLD